MAVIQRKLILSNYIFISTGVTTVTCTTEHITVTRTERKVFYVSRVEAALLGFPVPVHTRHRPATSGPTRPARTVNHYSVVAAPPPSTQASAAATPPAQNTAPAPAQGTASQPAPADEPAPAQAAARPPVIVELE